MEQAGNGALESDEAVGFFSRIIHNTATAWVVLLLSLMLTGVAWYVSSYFVVQRANDHFLFEAANVRSIISKRMMEYEVILRGALGLFIASDNVTRAEWRTYVGNLDIERIFPGVQGIGFSLFINRQDKDAHIAAIRAEGFPDYAVFPEGDREIYTSIIYLEPFNERNRRAFGYDMFSEPVRRAAMQRACDAGNMAVSGKVKLVQETAIDVQHGFLMYLPLYHKNVPVETVEQRRAALQGFVYSPFRIKDLMRGILGFGASPVGFEIFDGDAMTDETLIYSSHESGRVHPSGHALSQNNPLLIGGHRWTLHIYDLPDRIDRGGAVLPAIVAGGGIIVDLLLFYIITSISTRRREIAAMAWEMTKELRESHKIIDNKANALENVNAELRQFAYVASHDLQEPLRMVAGYVELLRRRYQDKLDGDADEFIRFAVEGATRMKNIIDDLLNLSRIDNRPHEWTIMDMNEAVNAALINVDRSIREADAAIIVGKLPTMAADGGLLTQVFQNLIENAVKYRHPDRRPEIHIGAAQEGTDWIFSVRDNGIGFEQEYADRVFIAFQRLHGRSKYQGTGIGLAICKKIIERHGGHIRVDSEPGTGSTFRFSIPIRL
ncbi:MAG: hypothetical protein A3G18_00900 [Rhodospirillales bacterium RIFCSPLOWO2_12_FULL_58_28]|nr:MAG: hypothetical protein A3H92_11610 [Rhodospirillales bacterium RIFCSPLOWO2_02_FULL_58_16]OHC79818.1 MAG: hypothetical protein A3G18_00900 [Rhodospirillales bacterium RIFCSPLOWO2_12_FULL_58_28]